MGIQFLFAKVLSGGYIFTELVQVFWTSITFNQSQQPTNSCQSRLVRVTFSLQERFVSFVSLCRGSSPNQPSPVTRYNIFQLQSRIPFLWKPFLYSSNVLSKQNPRFKHSWKKWEPGNLVLSFFGQNSAQNCENLKCVKILMKT